MGETATPTASIVGGATLVPLPEMFPADSCAGVETTTRFVLVAESDGEVVALLSTEFVLPILWPHAFVAVFDPDFTKVLDADGALFATAHEDITDHVNSGRWGRYNVCATVTRLAIWQPPSE